MKLLQATLAVCLLLTLPLQQALALPQLTDATWNVCGRDGVSNWDETTLVFTQQTDGAEGVQVEGYFNWQSDRGHEGREFFRGTIGKDRRVVLQGYRMEGSADLAISRYIGHLSTDAMRIFDGKWLDGLPGTWGAMRDGGVNGAAGICDAQTV